MFNFSNIVPNPFKILFFATIFAFGLLGPQTGPADAAFNYSALFANSGQALGGNVNTYAVALGDLDGDGDLDVYVGNRDLPDNVMLNNGKGSFSDTGQSIGNAHSRGLALGDLDGDGDLDAFVGGSGPNKVFLNNGKAVFTDSGQSLGSGHTMGLALGDLDGDGDLDAFVANYYTNKVVWLNNGSGKFVIDGTYGGNTCAEGVDLADLDGDGDLDAFVANYCGNSDEVWLNDSKGKFTKTSAALGTNNGLSISLADLDNDGDPDAFLGNASAPNRVLINDGKGNFNDNGNALGTYYTGSQGLADLDGDGDIDAFAGNYAGPNKIWINQGGAKFVDSGMSMGAYNSHGMSLGDLDGDGDIDAFVGNYGNPNEVWLNQSNVPAKGPVVINPASASANEMIFTYTGNVTPDADGWGMVGGGAYGKAHNSVQNGVLYINDASSAGGSYAQYTKSWTVKPGFVNVVELDMKLVTNNSIHGIYFGFSNGTHKALYTLYPGRVTSTKTSVSYNADTTGAYNTYKAVIENGQAILYINGEEAMRHPAATGIHNVLGVEFGAGSSAALGSVYVDEIRAYSTVPGGHAQTPAPTATPTPVATTPTPAPTPAAVPNPTPVAGDCPQGETMSLAQVSALMTQKFEEAGTSFYKKEDLDRAVSDLCSTANIPPIGVVHPYPNKILPSTKGNVSINLEGYAVDQKAKSINKADISVASAHLEIKGKDLYHKIILKGPNSRNRLDSQGTFKVRKTFKAVKGNKYAVELYATVEDPQKQGVVVTKLLDSTFINVPRR